MGNIKRYTFQNSGAEIDFGRFRTYDEGSSKPYRITVTGIPANYDNFIGTVSVYNTESAVLSDGSARISNSTAEIDLYVDDLFHSGWQGGVRAAFTFLISGTNYVYTDGAYLNENIGEGTWGRAPRYNFGADSSSVRFNQFRTNQEVFMPTAITITGLSSQYNNHLLSVILSGDPGYNQYGKQDSDYISSGSAQVTIYVSSEAGPLYIFLIVLKEEKVSSGGMEFPKNVPVAAYQTKTAKTIITGMMLGIGTDFEVVPNVPDIGGADV